MVWILPLLVIGCGLLLWRVRAGRRPSGEVADLHRRMHSPLADLVGVPIDRIGDVRLAAVILMLQLTRTGSPVTAAEKAQILAFMRTPLGIDPTPATYDVAWTYTQARRPFTLLADELMPLLRQRLTRDERLQLVDMLFCVASAHSAPGELQRAAILRLERCLMAPDSERQPDRIRNSAR